jgi:predicted RNase H-like HicB family nuclease
MAMEQRYTLLIHDESDGMLGASVEELPGCFASGMDLEELLKAAAEAIRIYLLDAGQQGTSTAEEIGYGQSSPCDVVNLASRRGHQDVRYEVRKAEICLGL